MSVQLIKKGGGFRPCETLATPLEVWTPRAEGATSCPAYAGGDEREGVNRILGSSPTSSDHPTWKGLLPGKSELLDKGIGIVCITLIY